MKKFYIAERLTLLSAIARSMDDSKRCCGLWYDEREPERARRHMTADLSREKLNLRAAGSVARTVTVLLSVIMLASPSVPTLTTDCVVQDSDIILRSSTLTELFSAMVSGDVLLEQLARATSVPSSGIVEPLALDV